MIQKRKIILPRPLRWCQGMRLPLRNQDGVEKRTTGSTSSNTDVDGNQNRHFPTLTLQTQHPQKQNPKKDKNGPEKSTRKFYTVFIVYQKTQEKHAQLKEPTNCGKKGTKQREYIDANTLANVRRDVLHKKQLTEAEINEIKEEIKAIVSKTKNNIERREEYREIESEDEEIQVFIVMVKQLF